MWNQPQIEMEKDDLYERLEAIFKEELEKIAEKNLQEIEQREKLPKFRMLSSIEKSANLILGDYLNHNSDMKEITDAVYAMGKLQRELKMSNQKGQARKYQVVIEEKGSCAARLRPCAKSLHVFVTSYIGERQYVSLQIRRRES